MSDAEPLAADFNPYQSPGEAIEFVEVPGDVKQESGEATSRSLEAMRATQPWVKMFGWFAAVLAAVRVIGLVFNIFQLGDDHSVGRLVGMGAALLYCVFFGVAGVLLLCYSSSINDFIISRRIQHLDDALQAQATFWRFFGMTTAIVIILALSAMLLFFGLAGASTFFF
jgi:hypothetical protein